MQVPRLQKAGNSRMLSYMNCSSSHDESEQHDICTENTNEVK